MGRYPHTVTVYNRLGEDGRSEKWTHTVIHGVRIEPRRGASRAVGGDRSLDSVKVFIPGSIRGYVSPESFCGEGWTLRERDVLVEGACDSPSPSGVKYPITYVDSFSRSSSRVHHFEVGGE